MGKNSGTVRNSSTGYCKLGYDSSFLFHEQPFRSRETPLFFGYNGDTLYGVMHHSCCPEINTGIVICTPFFMEKMEAYSLLANLARQLAMNGYPVLRFNYRGYGESKGEWGENSIPEYLEDIDEAIHLLRRETGVQSVGLLGVRMGASLSLMKLMKDNSISFAIAVEPVIHGKTYVRDLLRMNMAEQLLDKRKVRTGLRELVGNIQSGGVVYTAWFPLNRKHYEALMDVDLLQEINHVHTPLALFAIRCPHTAGQPVREFYDKIRPVSGKSIYREIECPPFWKQTPRLVRRIPALSEAVLTWLDELSTDNTFHDPPSERSFRPGKLPVAPLVP